jgi:hypothetical protein
MMMKARFSARKSGRYDVFRAAGSVTAGGGIAGTCALNGALGLSCRVKSLGPDQGAGWGGGEATGSGT